MVADLSMATRVERSADGSFSFVIPAGWAQGRGAFGGVVLGALARAMIESEADDARTLRAITGELAGPVMVGEARIEVSVLRRGSGLSSLTAVLSQGGEALARASAVLAKTRDVGVSFQEPVPPQHVLYTDVPVAPVGPPWAPEFTQFFEFRALGPPPFSGAAEAAASGWVRPISVSTWGAPEVIALADAWWPAFFAMGSAPRPVGTVAFALHHFTPKVPLGPGEAALYRARDFGGGDGFVAELRELWTPRGELLAVNQQTFAIIK
jgi:hypothetical protein